MSDMFKDKVILITGGSRGLGLAIAHAFGRAGGKIHLLARNAEQLATAAAELQAAGIAAEFTVANVQIDADVQAAAEKLQSLGGIDVLVNCVGMSDRGRVEEQTPQIFQDTLDINFLSVVRVTQQFLPQLIRSKGSIVNIGSLASKVVSPFMGSYPVSKFAVDAYSRQLRLELRPQGVNVLLVCPGPIQRDDAGQRYLHQSSGLPDAAMQPGGGARIRRLDPVKLSDRIVRACHQRQSELIQPLKTRLLMVIYAISPNLGDWILQKMVKAKTE